MDNKILTLAALAIGGSIVSAILPPLTVFIMLFLMWRGYLILTDEKPKHEQARLMRSATIFVLFLGVAFWLLMYVFLMARPVGSVSFTMVQDLDQFGAIMTPEPLFFRELNAAPEVTAEIASQRTPILDLTLTPGR